MNRAIHIIRSAIIGPGEEPDVSFVPPLVRRRLSPLQKRFFALAHAVGAEDAGWIVLASRDGEDTLTRRIVADYQADGTVSPQRFSSSVYNAAPGLWSVFAKNQAPYTAMAAGDDTVECGLLELFGGASVPGDAVLVYAEETGGGYGAALRIGRDSLDLSAERHSATSSRQQRQSGISALDDDARAASAPTQSISFACLAAFLRGERTTISGKWLQLQSI